MTIRILLLAIVLGTSFAAERESGDAILRGRVTISSGAPVAGVEVTAFRSGGERAGVAQTNMSGEWALAVPAGRYVLAFQSPGLAPRTVAAVQAPGPPEQVALTPSDTGIADANEQAVVYRPVVDTERTHQADFITTEQLDHLPVNRRNYLNLAALTPGVSEVTSYVGITDQPLVQAPQSGLSFGGNNGRGNVFWLDGGENYLNTGGVRPSISQEGVAEFQVARSNYSAELAGASAGL